MLSASTPAVRPLWHESAGGLLWEERMNIIIDDKKYQVEEKLPYHGVGMAAVIVKAGNEEKVAVKQAGKWRFWTIEDRLGR